MGDKPQKQKSPLVESMERAFRSYNNPSEVAKHYADDLLEGIYKVSDKKHRSIFLIILSTSLFLLTDQGTINRVDFAGTNISDVSLLIKISPLLLMYFYGDYILTNIKQRLMGAAYIIAFTYSLHNQQSIGDNQMFTPPFILFPYSRLNAWETIESFYSKKVSNITSLILRPFMYLLMFSPPLFFFYTQYRIFYKHGYYDFISFLLLFFGILFMAEAIITFLYTWSADARLDWSILPNA